MLPCDARGGYDFLPERPPRDSARGTSTVTARPADEATLAAARPRARLHSSQSITSEAAAIDEYVPETTPMTRAKAKSWSTSPPNRKRIKAERNTVNEVRMVRD